MWTTFLMLAGVVVGLILVVVAMRPAAFRFSRSTLIAAPSSEVFPLVNDFHNWETWSPWAKLDPNMQTTYEGPEEGTGASYAWSGDKNVGQGKMTILESRANELVKIKLEFLKPMVATNTTDFTFSPVGSQTHVDWTMTGKNDFMGNVFHTLMDMDAMLGKDFDKGLASMKAVAEGRPDPSSANVAVAPTPESRDRLSVEFSLLVARVIVGMVFAYHGAQKLFGMFDGPGLTEIVKMMGPLGYLVSVGECLGGIGIMLGFLSRFSAASNIVIMLGAIFTVHGANGFSLQNSGFEYNLALIGLLLPVMLAGPGRFSIGQYLPFPKSKKTGRTLVVLE
ncbi:MAG: DoxX family membrane protein [Planctomycetota bacterium]|nr:DoxX family membrane protein [Planctomycetota bacterium]MDA1211051.1 DoxX family membrane protein [Planctomycetota bacterium]